MIKKNNQKGFTIIELSIATVVFSVLLAICMAAFLNVGRLFVKGVNLSLTQQNTRTIMDSISSDIRFSIGAPPPTITTIMTNGTQENYFCVGQHRYKFILFNQVGKQTENIPEGAGSYYGLVREDVSAGCPDLGTAGAHPVEMLGSGMQLNELQFGPSQGSCSGNLCTITINLLFYGADNTVFTSSEHSADTLSDHMSALKDSDAHCAGNDLGTQFCATTSYTTSVLQSSL